MGAGTLRRNRPEQYKPGRPTTIADILGEGAVNQMFVPTEEQREMIKEFEAQNAQKENEEKVKDEVVTEEFVQEFTGTHPVTTSATESAKDSQDNVVSEQIKEVIEKHRSAKAPTREEAKKAVKEIKSLLEATPKTKEV